MTVSLLEKSAGARPRRLFVRAVGVALTLAGVAFTAVAILENDALGRLSWDAQLWTSLALACGAYAVLSALLVLVWASILDAFAPACIGAKDAFALYAITQVLKYIPSNVVHFVGRHVALRRRGVSHLALVSTVLAEAAMLGGGACLAILALKPDLLFQIGGRYIGAEGFSIALAVGATLCLGGTLMWLRDAGGIGRLIAKGVHRRLVPRLMVASAAATGFFAATSLLTAAICRFLLGDPAGFSTSAVAAGLAGAWLVGFVVPGASAGIGVREAAVILLLSPMVGTANAAAIATIYRIVTAGGDALLAGLGELVRRSPMSLRTRGSEARRRSPA